MQLNNDILRQCAGIKINRTMYEKIPKTDWSLEFNLMIIVNKSKNYANVLNVDSMLSSITFVTESISVAIAFCSVSSCSSSNSRVLSFC